MSREVRRVPLDFQWPLNKVWKGYVTPEELQLPDCPDCEGGYTHAAKWVSTLLNRLDMLASDVLFDQPRGKPLHPWLAQDTYPPTRTVYAPVPAWKREAARREIAECEARGVSARQWRYRLAEEASTDIAGYEVLRPSQDILDLLRGLVPEDRAGSVGELGSSFSYHAMKRLREAAGVPDDWGICPTCRGEGDVGTPEQRAACEDWEWEQPPTGDGWQYWETVSEGSPISPVFPTADALVNWLTTDYSWGAQTGPLTRAQAEGIVKVGHSLGSGLITSDGTFHGGDAVFDADGNVAV